MNNRKYTNFYTNRTLSWLSLRLSSHLSTPRLAQPRSRHSNFALFHLHVYEVFKNGAGILKQTCKISTFLLVSGRHCRLTEGEKAPPTHGYALFPLGVGNPYSCSILNTTAVR